MYTKEELLRGWSAKFDELKVKGQLYAQAGEAITSIGIGKMCAEKKLRRTAIAGALGAMVCGGLMTVGATAVLVKVGFLASIAAVSGSFIAGVKQGIKEMESVS